jgi:recombinational DNA repair ATPase RecF
MYYLERYVLHEDERKLIKGSKHLFTNKVVSANKRRKFLDILSVVFKSARSHSMLVELESVVREENKLIFAFTISPNNLNADDEKLYFDIKKANLEKLNDR